MKTIQLVLLFLAGLWLGNWMGDQATIRDCATKQFAHMLGGGTITCKIILP